MAADSLSLVQDLYRILALVRALASPSTAFSRTPMNRAEKHSQHEGKKHRRNECACGNVDRGKGDERGAEITAVTLKSFFLSLLF